jgi:dihydrofolate reductase
MRQLINSTYVTLDGLIGDMEKWHFGYSDDASERVASELLAGADTLLLGRHTYDAFAGAWPTRTGEMADTFNAMKKYVASTTLEKAEWNNTDIISTDLAETVARIKQEPGGHIVTYGFGPVAETLLQHGLLDELWLWIHPVLVGQIGTSETLFRDGNAATMTLLNTRVLDSGVVILSYRPSNRREG